VKEIGPMTDPTYDPAHDDTRLRTLRERVFDMMRARRWNTLSEIQAVMHHYFQRAVSRGRISHRHM